MKQLRAAFYLMLLLAGATVLATDLTSGVRERLLQPAVLRGEFEQSKQVAGFKKPLLSKGSFLVARERGVLWRTREPFASVLKLTRDEIVATQDGQVAFRLNASKEPSVRVINGLLFALLNGDVNGLAEHFQISGEVHGKDWQLSLTPKQAALAKIMRKIALNGDSYVRHIDIAEANGDQTTINFSAQSAEPGKLSADEAAQFD